MSKRTWRSGESDKVKMPVLRSYELPMKDKPMLMRLPLPKPLTLIKGNSTRDKVRPLTSKRDSGCER